MPRHKLGDWWFFVKVVARGPRGIWDLAPLGTICDHTSARLLQDLSAGVVETADSGDLLRAAYAASMWATDLDLLMSDDVHGPRLRRRYGGAVPVLADSLRAVEQAAHAAAVAGPADAQARAELHAALARFGLAFHPLLSAYLGVLKRLHANAVAVDPSRV
jgi:hypothetical protein